jgi:hypothetical protein
LRTSFLSQQTSRIRDCSTISIGRLALKAMNLSFSGRVSSRFHRSLYLELEEGYCCLVSGHLSAGPINVVTTSIDQFDIIMPDTDVFFVDEEVLIGDQLRLNTGGTPVWKPKSVNWSETTLAQGLHNLDMLCFGRNPDQGLSGLVWPSAFSTKLSPELEKAKPVFNSLIDWLRQGMIPKSSCLPPKEILNLLGLGPGLTPSGDDFLVGFLVALSILDRQDLMAGICEIIQPLISELTGPISGLHILAAKDGEASEVLHQALNSILVGGYDEISECLNAVSLVGHTSGWDALAGAITVLRESALVKP